ncbi:protein tyrosine phosphatase receptor type Na [Latimeria chalumnae]|uniref:protein tyrosine phosphatase receptor type Na n=1 Tax=Latimeria chalumnae TaxID=7897 RepID=UPI00313AE654
MEMVQSKYGLFGHCQDSSLRDRTHFELSTQVLERLQKDLKQLMLQGLSWQDDITQYVISHDLERVPKVRLPPEPEQRADDRSARLSFPNGPVSYPGVRFPSRADRIPYVQRYLQYTVYAPQPDLQQPRTMEESLLGPYPYHKYGYQNGRDQLGSFRGHTLSMGLPPSRQMQDLSPSPEWWSPWGSRDSHHTSLTSHRLSHQQEQERKMIRDLIMLYLAEEKLGAIRPERERDTGEGPPLDEQQPDGTKDLPTDFPEDEGPLYQDATTDRSPEEREQQRETDYSDMLQEPRLLQETALKRLAAMLKPYGIDLRDLSEEQASSLSSLLHLLQTDRLTQTDVFEKDTTKLKRMTEGEIQVKAEDASNSLDDQLLKYQGNNDTLSGQTGLRDKEENDAGGFESAAQSRPTEESGQEMEADVTDASSTQIALGPLESEGGISIQKKRSSVGNKKEETSIAMETRPKEEYGYIVTNQILLDLVDGARLLQALAERVHLSTSTFINISVVGPALTFRVRQNDHNMSTSDVADRAAEEKSYIEKLTGLKIIQTGIGERNEFQSLPHSSQFRARSRFEVLDIITISCIVIFPVLILGIFCHQKYSGWREKHKLAALGPEAGTDATFEYQDLCRQHMAAKSPMGRAEVVAIGAASASGPTEPSRVSSVSSQFSDGAQASPSSHSSTPSWCEEPAQSNMDISTGHMILAYMEDHLRNKDRLAKEWEALCAYQAEPNACILGQSDANVKKNRNPDFVPYDHARMKLKADINPSRTDYINASPIIEHDPRMPAYIATQGPLSHTIADFWQMVWENGCTVIVMLAPLVEDGVKQCDRYWPDEGSSLYHIYEVNLVSEHIWCEDFLVRSFYLKNVQSQETRTLTQFHFLSWPAEGIPTSTRPLLDFRRKVNKCYRGRSCPIIVHCSDGAGRTGTYILIDMVLNRMAKGVKEIDIAATLEHIRDQRPGMVRTKDQFEFALTAVAEEVNAILKALPQ